MAVPSNLYQKDSLKGNREDLLDKIYNVSPTETPLGKMFGDVTATSTFHEWQRDALGAANANNAMIDGDDATMTAQVPTDRVGNHTQRFSKVYGVSNRANIIKKAGRDSEIGYIRLKNLKEIKRDVEAMIVSSNPAVASTTSVAGKSAGLGVQLYASALHNGAGATASWTSGAPTTAVTAGTNRAFTEALFKTACQNVYANAGEFVTMAVMSPSHKATFSAFTGIAQNRFEVKGKSQGTVVGAADVYISDFGAISIVPHYLMSGANEVYLLNPDYIDMAYLEAYKKRPLAVTGDSERELLTVDVALAVRNSAAQAKIDDLTP